MKIEKYLLNQSSLMKYQINKNHKLVKELILPKTHNYINTSKDKIISVHDIINPRKNIAEILKDENDLFIQLYTKTKKLYPTKVEETFKDLILQYKNNDYKIPDLSDKKNLFNQNPLLLVGRDLDQFYMYNDRKTKTKLSKKHINFIKKEMMCMEKVINKNSQNQNILTNNNYDIYADKSDIDSKKEKINYFYEDSVWDKIKEQKLKQKNLEIIKKKKEKLKKKYKSNINIKIKNNKSADKPNNNKKEKTKIDSYNTFKKYNSSLKNINNMTNLKSINSNETLKNILSIDTITTNKSESPIIKLKHNLFRNVKNKKKNKKNNLFDNNGETDKLQKEINEIKNTLNNSNLIEKNIIIEPYRMNRSYKKNNIYYKTYYNSFINKENHSLIPKKSFPRLSYNNNKKIDKNNKKQSISTTTPKDIPEKNDDTMSKESKFDSLKIFELIKKRTLPFLTITKLLKEKNPQKFLYLLSKVDFKIFNRKEIEKLMKSFCEKILGYTEKEIERILNINKNDENIYRIIDKTIKKTKKNKFKYYGNYSLQLNLDKVNNSIYDLKKKFIYGKTDYNYES